MPSPRSVAALALVLAGCGKDPEPAGDDDAAASSSGSGSPATDTASTAADPSSTGGSSSGDGEDTSGADTTGAGTTGAPGPDVKGACIAACEHLMECGLEQDLPNCETPCGGVVGFVTGCEEPYVAQQECVTALSCEDVMAWDAAMGRDYPCATEDAALSQCSAD